MADSVFIGQTVDLSSGFVTGILPTENGGTGTDAVLTLEEGHPETLTINGAVPAHSGGTSLLGLNLPGAVLTAGNSIAFRNPGIGNGTGYSIAVTGAQGAIGVQDVAGSTGIPFGLFNAGSFGFWYTPMHQGGDGYGVLLTGDVFRDNLGLYIQDADATHVHLDWYEGTDQLNTTPLVVGTRYFIGITCDAAGAGKFYVNGVLDGTFTVSLTLTLRLFWANNFNEVLRASFLSDVCHFPTAVVAGTLLALYTSGSNVATAPATYQALVVTTYSADHYWKLDEAGPITFDAFGVEFTFADSVGALTMSLVDAAVLVPAGATGTALAGNGLTIAPSFQTVPITKANPAQSANKSGNFTVFSYTPPATAGTYRVSGVITTRSGTNTGTVGFTLDYKDSQGATHTADVIPVCTAAGAYATTGTGSSKEFHAAAWMISIDNSATAIALKVVITGTVDYTVTGAIEQIG